MALAPTCPISSYSASPPVSARNTAPITTNEILGSAIKKLTASVGLTALRMAGLLPLFGAAAPIRTHGIVGSAIKKLTAAVGLPALRVAGAIQILAAPRPPMTTNQITMTG